MTKIAASTTASRFVDAVYGTCGPTCKTSAAPNGQIDKMAEFW